MREPTSPESTVVTVPHLLETTQSPAHMERRPPSALSVGGTDEVASPNCGVDGPRPRRRGIGTVTVGVAPPSGRFVAVLVVPSPPPVRRGLRIAVG